MKRLNSWCRSEPSCNRWLWVVDNRVRSRPGWDHPRLKVDGDTSPRPRYDHHEEDAQSTPVGSRSSQDCRRATEQTGVTDELRHTVLASSERCHQGSVDEDAASGAVHPQAGRSVDCRPGVDEQVNEGLWKFVAKRDRVDSTRDQGTSNCADHRTRGQV